MFTTNLITILTLMFALKARVYNSAHLEGEDKYPKVWPYKYPTCNGLNQSPINIDSSRVILYRYLPPLTTVNDTTEIDPTFFKAHKEPDDARQTVLASGGPLFPNRYKLIGIHFHWGYNHQDGSEHRVDGSQVAMEIHMVHVNMKYEDIGECVKHPDGLFVIGIMAKISNRGDQRVERVIQNLVDSKPVELSNLYPEGKAQLFDYWTYSGSLTTPKCNEAITWVLVAKPFMVTFDQIKRLQMIPGLDGHKLIRPAQPLNGRIVKLVKFEVD